MVWEKGDSIFKDVNFYYPVLTSGLSTPTLLYLILCLNFTGHQLDINILLYFCFFCVN